MSRWKEAFNEHPVHESLGQLISWLNVNASYLDESSIEEIRRASKALELLKNALEQVDPEAAPFKQLDAINSQLRHQNLWNQIDAFYSNHNVDNIKAANEAISGLLHFPGLLGAVSTQSLAEAGTTALELSSEKLSKFISEERQRQSDHISSLSGRINELEQEKEKLSSTIESRRQEVDQQLAQWQKQFSEAQEKRSDAFSSWRNETSSEIDERFNELETTKKEQLNQLDAEAKNTLDRLFEDSREKNERIRELYELTSGDSISGGYAKTSEQESTQANHWRLGSVVFIFFTAAWLMFAYAQFERAAPTLDVAPKTESVSGAFGYAQINWPRVLVSFSLTGVLLFGAAYCAQQSNKHRSEAKKSRTFALQIKALDPYISSLEKPDQAELKKKLTEIFFVGPIEDSSPPQGSLDPHAVAVVSKVVTDALKAARS